MKIATYFIIIKGYEKNMLLFNGELLRIALSLVNINLSINLVVWNSVFQALWQAITENNLSRFSNLLSINRIYNRYAHLSFRQNMPISFNVYCAFSSSVWRSLPLTLFLVRRARIVLRVLYQDPPTRPIGNLHPLSVFSPPIPYKAKTFW